MLALTIVPSTHKQKNLRQSFPH